MRFLIFLVLAVLVVVAGVAYEMGWLSTQTANDEGKSQLIITVNKEQWERDRATFHRQAEAKLDDLKRQLDDFNVKAGKASAQSRAAMEKEGQVLRQKYDAARNELKELDSATQERWENVKGRLSRALDDLDAGFHKAASQFR